MRFAIPSNKRSKIICEKTLSYLNNNFKHPQCIEIFVEESQHVDYEVELERYNFGNIIYKLIDCPYQLSAKINYIVNDYYDDNEYVVYLEDDLTQVKRLMQVGNKKQLVIQDNFDLFCLNCEDIIRKNNIYLWGVYPVNNA
jgi:hypothetical protein